jgi:hypothetical protein
MILTGKYSFPCIIPHCLITVIHTIACFLCLLPYMHNFYCLYAHLYAIALRGGNTTPSLVADAFLSSVSRSQVYVRDC